MILSIRSEIFGERTKPYCIKLMLFHHKKRLIINSKLSRLNRTTRSQPTRSCKKNSDSWKTLRKTSIKI